MWHPWHGLLCLGPVQTSPFTMAIQPCPRAGWVTLKQNAKRHRFSSKIDIKVWPSQVHLSPVGPCLHRVRVFSQTQVIFSSLGLGVLSCSSSNFLGRFCCCRCHNQPLKIVGKTMFVNPLVTEATDESELWCVQRLFDMNFIRPWGSLHLTGNRSKLSMFSSSSDQNWDVFL